MGCVGKKSSCRAGPAAMEDGSNVESFAGGVSVHDGFGASSNPMRIFDAATS